MKRRLTDHLNSQYIEAANRLKPQTRSRTVVAYVESYDDIWFWRSVLQEFETADLKFEVMLPSRDSSLQRGKKSAMQRVQPDLGLDGERAVGSSMAGSGQGNRMSTSPMAGIMQGGQLGGSMIACVDADFDYLMQGKTEYSASLLNNPYIIHTQVYSIENYQCYAEGLREACVMATLNDNELLDLAAFVHEYSRIIWPLFVWVVWSYRHGRFKQFSMADFAQVVSMHDVDSLQPMKTLEKLRHRVNSYQNQLYRRFPEGKKTYPVMRGELQRLGVRADNCYLYMQGHTLFDGVVMPLLTPICARLRREREQEINRMACHEQQRQNELACYQHSILPIDAMLKKSTFYKVLPEYEKVREQIRKIFTA